ncbi:nucleotidyltransferase family protein [Ignavibacteria bacterium 4148-Me]|uniref:nucleotidyltransferase family protein n=1 Tax=Rosettibacter primus TaxID=3111523 RepID=UPI00336C25E1
MKAFILAAGLGTRLRPLTDSTPKALIKINGIPLLEIIIKRLIKFGFNKITINVHHLAEQIIDFIEKNKFDADIFISDERNLLLDTGGGLKKASSFFDDGFPFLIHNVDVLSDINLIDFYEYHKNQDAIATIAVQKRNSSRYFLFDNENNLCGWKNSKTSETKIVRASSTPLNEYAFSGIHIVNPDIFNHFPRDDVFSIIDFYLAVAVEKRITFYDHSKNFFFDLGKKENLQQAEIFLSSSNFLKELR